MTQVTHHSSSIEAVLSSVKLKEFRLCIGFLSGVVVHNTLFCQANDIHVDGAVTFGLLSSSDVWRVQCVHVCYTDLTAVTTDDSS